MPEDVDIPVWPVEVIRSARRMRTISGYLMAVGLEDDDPLKKE